MYKLLRPLIMLLPPEMAHKLSHGVFNFLYPVPTKNIHDPVLTNNVLGMHFLNPVGIAAGFDKDAKITKTLYRAGFGFVEVGTLTPKPQKGNPKPRLFRLLEDEALVNRLGFNNEGFQKALDRLDKFPKNRRNGPLGINIGANKTSTKPINDYLLGLEQFFKTANYFTINISSPNTPGLRDLQTNKNFAALLTKLRKKWIELGNKAGEVAPPMLIKIAPDMDKGQLKVIVKLALKAKIDGLIISNTTVDRPDSLISKNKDQEGGLSGQPLFEPSTALLKEAYKISKGKLILIGVGGVSNGQQAYEKILAGASLIQLYTGLIYEGPSVANTITRDLADILRSNGYSSIKDAIGKGVDLSKN